MAASTEEQLKVTTEQFKRNLSHILIPKNGKGPEITIGDTVLQFKEKVPVTALAVLIGTDNRIDAMRQYLLLALEGGPEIAEQFEALLDQIDIAGLSEIMDALGQGYTSFPEKS